MAFNYNTKKGKSFFFSCLLPDGHVLLKLWSMPWLDFETLIRILKRTVTKVIVSCIMSQQCNRAIECAAYYMLFAVFRIKINAEGTFGWDFSNTAVQQRRATV